MSIPSPEAKPLSIFVLHASDLFTNYKPHGDGISAFGFLHGLALRGHQIHVAVVETALRGSLPPALIPHQIRLRFAHGFAARLEYAIRARILFERLRRDIPFDIVQQMVPVKTGLSLGMIGIREPLVLGTFVARWPHQAHHYPPKPVPLRKIITSFFGRIVTFGQIIFARALLVTSPAAAEHFPFKSLFRTRTYEIHHGIDIAAFSPASSEDELRPKTVLFLGTLGVYKGILTLVEAFDIVHREVTDARLLIVGTGKLEQRIRDRLAQLECNSSVKLLGAVPRADVAGLMRSAAIFCAPAYGEPYATSLLEAMACGSAVVVTDSGGAPFMVPANGGRCIPERDPDLLARALIELLKSPDRTREMGECNRTFVEEQYSLDKVIDKLEDVYRIILGNLRPPTDLTTSDDTFGARLARSNRRRTGAERQ